MRLKEFKTLLNEMETIHFKLENGSKVPEHVHVTEVGLLTRNYIDCGGSIREDKTINIQLWYSTDTDHRLSSEKLLKIIAQSEKLIDLDDHEIEVEYQMETISKFGLSQQDGQFILTSKQTACLAEDQCGIPAQKPKLSLKELSSTSASCCTPNSKCC